MPKGDFYEILGVPPQAGSGDIKRAYRRIAFALHPDVGERSDPERFRQAHEAYQILSNPEERRAYDIRVGNRQPPMAEPLRANAPVTITEDFLTFRPSVEELLDHIRQNFFGYRPKSGGPYRRLGMEAILEQEEARFGCRLPFNVPGYVDCEQCGGSGEWRGICPDCYGRGVAEGTRRIVLEIPPGVRDGERFEIDLSYVGISNLLLEVRVVVP
jgi:molecular chaperone DnaJ